MSVDLSKYLKAQKESYPIAYSKVLHKQYESGWVDFVFPRMLEQCDSPRSREYGLDNGKVLSAFWKNKLLRENYTRMITAIRHMTVEEFKQVFSARAQFKILDSINLFIQHINNIDGYQEELSILSDFKSEYLI